MTSAGKAAMEKTIIFSIAAVYVVQQFTQLGLLTPVIGSLVFITISLFLTKLKGITQWLTISFIVVGAVLLLIQKATARDWFEAASINVTIVTLFLFAPLFGIPVRIPEYVDALKRFYEEKLRSKTGLFVGTQFVTQILGVFVNVGSIPVVYEMVFVKPRGGMPLLLANALNRGFAGAILWSPYFAAMTLVTSALTLPWSSVVPYLFGLSVLSLVVSWAVDLGELRKADQHLQKQVATRGKGKAAFPLGLGMYLAFAIIVILVLEQAFELPMVILICMAAGFLPLIWNMVKGAMAEYRQGLKNHFNVTIPALQKEMTLFLAAGFFSGSVGTMGFGAAVPALLEHIPLPIYLTFSIFTVALIGGTSLLGLHPIVLVTILANGIDPLDMHISPMYFAVLLLGSWGLSNPISPASAVNNLLAGLFKKPVLELAVPNYKFAGCMAIALIFYLAAVMH